MSHWVVLRHDTPDGGWHYDWMLDAADAPAPPGPGGGGGLVTFRVTDRPDDPRVRAFHGERLPDHRREYLTYEGPVSGGRGSVRREAGGRCRVEFVGERGLAVVLLGTPDGDRRWVGQPDVRGPLGGRERWAFTLAPADWR